MKVSAFLLLVLLAGCKERQAQLRFTFPVSLPDGGVDAGTDAGVGGCEQYSIKCVNYLEFSAGDVNEFSSECTKVDIAVDTLCDLVKLADGRELFKLSPDIKLPIKVEGKRIYPAIGCNNTPCPAKVVFSAETKESGPISNFVGQVLELPVMPKDPCGPPEQFFPLPDGDTCADVCHSPDLLVCDQIPGGCLCKKLPDDPVVGPSVVDGGQDGIDSGQ